MRDLASVVTIETKNKMFEKDRICVVSFKELGYEAIVPVEHNIGDRMVFIQEGSILPEIERWEFLRKRCYNDALKGFLIKPMTMGCKDLNGEKGDRVKSWGLCVSLAEAGLSENLKAGTDVTDKLGIRKYEPEEDASPKRGGSIPRIIRFFLKHKLTRWIGNAYMRRMRKNKTISNFPTEIIQKSDETTIQNYKAVINSFAGVKGYITCKMEGQSFTTSLDRKTKKFYVCSRNNRYDCPDEDGGKLFFETAKRYDIESKLKAYFKKTGDILVVQGEQCGPGIQGNIYDFAETRWFVFRLKAITSKGIIEYNYEEMEPILNQLGLERVPLFEIVDDMSKYASVEALVKLAETAVWKPDNFNYKPTANDKMWTTYLQHEGIVIKSANYDKEKGKGFSFKVKNLSYAEHDYGVIHEIAHKLSK